MSTRVEARTAATVPVPEPNLTAAEMIGRAVALRPRLRAEQDETERRGVHSEAPAPGISARRDFIARSSRGDSADTDFDLKYYYRLAIELSRGDPSTGWCVILGAGHSLMLGSFFSEEAQAAAFGPEGNFHGPSVAAPGGHGDTDAPTAVGS